MSPRVFLLLNLALIGAPALVWYHPAGTPVWTILGKWQTRLDRNSRSPSRPWLTKILTTHWIRTALINGAGLDAAHRRDPSLSLVCLPYLFSSVFIVADFFFASIRLIRWSIAT